MCCLTHDIDFAGIRMHKIDHTILGFLYRALFGSLRDILSGRGSWTKLHKNWKAAIILPAVYMGIAEDFWMPFRRYREIEKELHSTFFIIPFKNNAGMSDTNQKRSSRASRYDCSDIKKEMKDLLSQGCEIGVHGIDAWQDTEKGRREFDRIHEITETSEMGIRMHWLYFNDQSPKILEETGFCYDSTLGYNDAVGYRGGTVQVFRPIGLKRLFELPLNVQDTALFYPDRMGLNEEHAWQLINELLENASRYGGVMTINWHDRSLAPERLWGDTYIKLLKSIKRSDVWTDTASRVIRWFDKRRSAVFEDVCFAQDRVKLHISSKNDDDIPDLMLRIHTPRAVRRLQTDHGQANERHVDISFAGSLNAEYPL